MSLAGIREQLISTGFNNAMVFDGSSSATLVRNGVVEVAPIVRKDNSIEVGIGVKVNKQ